MTYLVEDILGCAAQKNGASLWVLALNNAAIKFIPDLLHLEEPSTSSNVGLLDLFWPANYHSVTLTV